MKGYPFSFFPVLDLLHNCLPRSSFSILLLLLDRSVHPGEEKELPLLRFFPPRCPPRALPRRRKTEEYKKGKGGGKSPGEKATAVVKETGFYSAPPGDPPLFSFFSRKSCLGSFLRKCLFPYSDAIFALVTLSRKTSRAN